MPTIRSREHPLDSRGRIRRHDPRLEQDARRLASRRKHSAVTGIVLGLLLLTVADSSWAATKQQCENILAARQALKKDSDQLGRKIAKMKTCSQAQIATAQKRHKAMDAIIKAGDWIVQNCPGWEVDKAGRSKNVSTLKHLANFKNTCAAIDDLEELVP